MRSTSAERRLVVVCLLAGFGSPVMADSAPSRPRESPTNPCIQDCRLSQGGEPEPQTGQETASRAAPRETKPFGWRQFREDVKWVARRPFHLDRRGKRKVLAIAGTTLALYLARDEIRGYIQDHPSATWKGWANTARDVVGKGAFAPALALAAWTASFATRNEREKETAFLLLESMALTTAATAAGSFTLAAQRPGDGDSIRLFDPHGHGVSLDAALAASVISPLRRQYLGVRPGDSPTRRFWKRLSTGVLLAGAALTAYQRMEADKHWAPDVFLGIVTGLEVGRALGESHDGAAATASALTLGLLPRGVGFQLVFEPGHRSRR